MQDHQGFLNSYNYLCADQLIVQYLLLVGVDPKKVKRKHDGMRYLLHPCHWNKVGALNQQVI